MKRYGRWLVLAVIFLGWLAKLPSRAQVSHIEIAAGTPEDHDLQAITSEQDATKKLAMYADFVQKYASNPAAVAYGNWQISQAYQASGDFQKGLDYGDKALAGSPHNLDILVGQASMAQQSKNNAKLLDYAVKGGEVCASVGKQAKPDGVSDEEFARHVAEEKTAVQSSCEFLETSGFNAIQTETDPHNRLDYIEKFSAAFPESKFKDQVSSYAMETLGPGQLNDMPRLIAYCEKTLAANPNSLVALLELASFYSEDAKPGSAAKAVGYAQKAIAVANPDAPDADATRKLSAGVAHSTLGYAYMKQEKTAAAIPELKSAAVLLKGQNDVQYAIVLYRLGFAYAKLIRNTEARDVLLEAVKIPGPVQSMSQDLLNKVNAARAKGK
jgi:tetratricopeptide (TPR) repeat protein